MKAQDSITLSDITNLLQQGAVLRWRGLWHLIWGPFETSPDPINDAISIFCPDFYDFIDQPYLVGQFSAVLTHEQFSSLLESFLHSRGVSALMHRPLAGIQWQEPSIEKYRIAFTDVQRRLQQGEVKKAVPVVFARAEARPTEVDLATMVFNLLEAPSTLFVHGIWDAKQGLLGATPETLFVMKDKDLQTMALAGTCPKSDHAKPDNLLRDPKERQEHQLVVDDICEVLQAFGDVQVAETQILDLPTLWHLKTEISAQIKKQMTCKELVLKLHPTPALGVSPRKAGYQWMKEYPGQEGRGRYGAPFVFVFPQTKEVLALVAIRNIQWNENEILIGSGAGLVAASEFEREWRELAQKRDSVRKILGV